MKYVEKHGIEGDIRSYEGTAKDYEKLKHILTFGRGWTRRVN